MKRLSNVWMMTLLLSGLTALAGCSSSDDETMMGNGHNWSTEGLTMTRDANKQNTAIVVRDFERNGMKLQMLDITERFSEAKYYNQTVPIKHVLMKDLPAALQPIVESWGMSALTKVFRIEYKGSFYYEISNMLSSAAFDFFDESGAHCWFCVYQDEFMSQITGACCVLVLDVGGIKSAEDAPNYLVGFWENDWEHLIHYEGQTATVALYPDLNFKITEVLNFREDGSGYLRTVKEYKDGKKEIALDPFRYELTDYHGGEAYGYHGYYYKCYFEAGDIIEYLQRSYDNMQTLLSPRCFVNYPWFKKAADRYDSFTVNAGQKYGMPARDSESRIVGRWTGVSYSESLMTDIKTTWVFRSDNTGYRLIGEQYDESFAYTVSYHDSEADLTIYKYNTGFLLEDGFAKSIADMDFDPTILPKGKSVKARFNEDSLELEGWADNYHRVE